MSHFHVDSLYVDVLMPHSHLLSHSLSHLLSPSRANQILPTPFDVELHVKRLDLLHPLINGNKPFKLKYNIEAAIAQGCTTLLTFGGAYSNHIAATAAMAQALGLHSIGIIRGHELAHSPHNELSLTLQRAQAQGMQLHFVSREEYRLRNDAHYLAQLQHRFPHAYMIPEGGSNALGVQGCADILTNDDRDFYDVVACAVATGATFAGLINSAAADQQLYGIAVLKGDFLLTEVEKWTMPLKRDNWQLCLDAHHGGYGKISTALQQFVDKFNAQYDCPIEPIYTGKLFYHIWQLLQQGHFAKGTRLLLIHSGGLQYSQRH